MSSPDRADYDDAPYSTRLANADELVDELIPEELDWRRLVRTYPLSSVAVAAVGGFLLGRGRGREILVSLSGFVADTFTEQVNEALGKDVL